MVNYFLTNQNNIMMKTTKIIQKIAFLSLFALIMLCVQCKKKETPCVSCSVKFKELTNNIEISKTYNTLSECEEAKTAVGQTVVENGLAITVSEVVCK
jgi:hypothetical protein